MPISVDKRDDGSLALFIDGDLQFDSKDERIYHECLVLPALSLMQSRRKDSSLRVLVIGGGDGLSARELLKSSLVSSISLVDYDKNVIELAKTEFAHINENSMHDERLRVHAEDAWKFVENALAKSDFYDLVISDLTVAHEVEDTRFHSIEWYEKLKGILAPEGILAINTLSPAATPHAYWSVFNGIILSGLSPLPYHIVQPSFYKLGYGRDWGFILASTKPFAKEEFSDDLVLTGPRYELKDTEHLRKLFVFPAEIAEPRAASCPGYLGSDILFHYMNNGYEPDTTSGEKWNTLDIDISALPVPPAEKNNFLLPPEIRQALANTYEAPAQEEEIIFRQVLQLMPALRRFQTRRMVSEFLKAPADFLEGIDIVELVRRLLKRAAELPAKLVEELELLWEKLSDWSGDYRPLLQLGSRVLTIVALVVIVGNLFYPDAAYGKGEHGGHGGEHGGHAGERHDGGGERGDRGDRGDRGFGHHFDHYGHWGNHWGGYGNWGGYGRWGGWARPWHTGYWGGWGGWGVPFYAGGPGYINLSYNSNNSTPNQTVDAEGSAYPARNYRYQPNYVNNYNWNGESENNSSPASAPAQEQTAQQDNSNYRLGPDADILPGGKIALQLTDNYYLLVTAAATQIMDQATGRSVMTLASDPSLLYHLSTEIKRQNLGLQSAAQSKQSSNEWQGQLGFQGHAEDGQREVQNIQTVTVLLGQASQSLGDIPDAPPQNIQAPVPGAIEVFASTWMTADGSYLIMKRPDGSLAYMNGKGWYSDMGVTALKQPYPAQFRSVVVSYLNTLVKEADATKNSLTEDQQEGQDRLQKMKDQLSQLQQGGDMQSANGADSGDMPGPEAGRRLQQAIRRTEHRLAGIQKEMDALPEEITAANKLIATLEPANKT